MPTYSIVNNFFYEFPCALSRLVILYLQMNDTMNTSNAGLDPQNASHAMAFVSSNEDFDASYDGAGFPGCGDGSDDLADYNADEADDYANEGGDYANESDNDTDPNEEDFGWGGDENVCGE